MVEDNGPMEHENQLAIFERCIAKVPFAWEEFVDSFMDPVLLAISATASGHEVALVDDEKGNLCEAVFRSFRYNEFQLLREFDGRSSAVAYLTVLTRRLVVGFLKVH